MGAEIRTPQNLSAVVAALRASEGWQDAESEREFVFDRETRVCYTVLTRRRDGSPAEVANWGEAIAAIDGGPVLTAEDAKRGEEVEWFDVGRSYVWRIGRKYRDVPVIHGRAENPAQMRLEVA